MDGVPQRAGQGGHIGKLRKAAAVLEDDEGELDGIDDEELENLLALGLTELAQIMPSRIDAVSDPANGVPVLMMKSARAGRPAVPGPRLAARLVKAQPEHRVTLHVAYPVNRADRSRAMDGFQDVAGPEALEQACWSFMKSGQAIGLDHADGTEGAGRLVESSIYRGPAYVMKAVDGSEQEIATGDWLIAVQWSPETWQQIKAGRYNGVSMQGGAVRRKPSRETLAALRKAGSAGGMEVSTKAAKQLRKAARQAVHDEAAHLRRQAESLGRKVDRLEKARRPKCEHCGKRAGSPVSRFCTKCGHPLGAAVGKSVAPAAVSAAGVERAARLVAQARSADPAVRDRAVAALSDLGGPGLAVKAVTRAVTGADLASALRRDAVAKAGGDVLSGAEEAHLAALLRKASSADPEVRLSAYGELIEKVGSEVTTRIISGDLMSPEQFRRAYLRQGRQREEGAGGKPPRIPLATHVISADDFRRGPLGAGQSRPAPGSVWPGSGGQADSYGPGPGVRAPYVAGQGVRAGLAGSHS